MGLILEAGAAVAGAARDVAAGLVSHAVTMGLDYSYVRAKKAWMLAALGQVGVGSSIRVVSSTPERRKLDELAGLAIVAEAAGAVELVDFGAHFTLVRVGDLLRDTGVADRDYFKRKGTLIDPSGVALRQRAIDLALRVGRLK